MKNIDILVKLAAPTVEYGPRAEADLARILATPASAPPRPRRPRSALGLAAALLLVALSSLFIFRPPAVSATPPLLDATPIAGTASSHLTGPATLRRSTPATPASIELHAWTLVTYVDATGKIVASNTSPTITSRTFQPDGSVTIETVAGSPFPGQAHKGLPPAGTPLSSQHLPPEETVTGSLPSPMPETADDLLPWLTETLAVDPSNTKETVLSLLSILLNTPATPGQEAAALEYLSTRTDVTLTGHVTDRLGRPGMSFHIGPDEDEYRLNLIISPETGQLIATETIYVGHNRTDIPNPTVTSYEAWQRK